ncbi:alpha/beta hydrolase [Devosia pacifica]|uniref:Alpha/beta hydrolase n=1 Tax=Devosia pacifica TaxID=1335967 RepID=A0A918VRA8_9HYPH|nr:alpha/beta hydrolase [Devosia pacifica]GHA15987.1 alpha/beta hydrolase [Devosia pacifica]
MALAEFSEWIGDARFGGFEGGEGLPVVFLHAGVADHRMWRDAMEMVVAAGYRAFAYDRRGFGLTESPDEPFSHIDDLEAVLDARGIQAAVLVGASMGGALALDFALENPERIAGLVLVGTALSGADEPDLPDEILPLIEAMDIADERGDRDMQIKVAAHAWLDGPLSRNGRVEGPARVLFEEMNAAIYAKPQLSEEIEAESIVDDLEEITAPTLLVVGELDFPHIIARHDDLSDVLENTFATIVEGTAHLPPLERPAVFNRLLQEFLEAITGQAPDA